MDPAASTVITAALILYTVGVWSERLQGRLKPWHLLFFWAGLACDTFGTGMMLDFAGGLTTDAAAPDAANGSARGRRPRGRSGIRRINGSSEPQRRR